MNLRDTHRRISARYPRILRNLAEGPDAPQTFDCELCGEPECSPDDFIAGLGAVICPICLETLMDAQTLEQQP